MAGCRGQDVVVAQGAGISIAVILCGRVVEDDVQRRRVRRARGPAQIRAEPEAGKGPAVRIRTEHGRLHELDEVPLEPGGLNSWRAGEGRAGSEAGGEGAD